MGIEHSNSDTGATAFRTTLLFGVPLLVIFAVLSLRIGTADISFEQIFSSFTDYQRDDSAHLMIRELRLPRALTAVIVGMALGSAGALMQGVTSNPLADAGLMGISSGGGFAVALSLVAFPGSSYLFRILLSFFGGAASAALVLGLSASIPGGQRPVKMILAGVSVTTVLSALSQGIALYGQVSQNLAFWTMGSVGGSSWEQLLYAVPLICVSLVLALFLSGPINVMSLGEESAIGLGVRTAKLRLWATALVVLLAGTSVALAGVISFVGIIAPHLSRFLAGGNYRRIIPMSTLIGGLLVLCADMGSRLWSPASDIPVGTVISIIGVPLFLSFSARSNTL